MIEPGSHLRLMTPKGRTALELLFGDDGKPVCCRSKGLCEDLTEEVVIERYDCLNATDRAAVEGLG